MVSVKTEKIAPFIFLIPPLLTVGVIIYGIITTIFFSFTNAKLVGGTIDFVGLQNYASLFSDPLFYTSLKNNLIFLFFIGIVPLFLGLFIAILLSMKVRGAILFKSLFFFPLILSFVVTGNIWSWLYLSEAGLINTGLRTFGLGFLAMPWLSSTTLAVPAMGITGIWQLIGLPIILFSAGLIDIPKNMIDASRLDATTFQTYRYVVIPLLKPVFVGVATISIISAWKIFDLILIMTYGGPLTSSYVLAFFVFIKTLSSYQVGYGSAAATILFLVSLITIVVLVLLAKGRKQE